MGTTLYVMVDNAAGAEAILGSQQCLNKESSYKYVKEAASCDGLFTSEGI